MIKNRDPRGPHFLLKSVYVDFKSSFAIIFSIICYAIFGKRGTKNIASLHSQSLAFPAENFSSEYLNIIFYYGNIQLSKKNSKAGCNSACDPIYEVGGCTRVTVSLYFS